MRAQGRWNCLPPFPRAGLPAALHVLLLAPSSCCADPSGLRDKGTTGQALHSEEATDGVEGDCFPCRETHAPLCAARVPTVRLLRNVSAMFPRTLPLLVRPMRIRLAAFSSAAAATPATTAAAASASAARPKVTSAQLRAQRPRAPSLKAPSPAADPSSAAAVLASVDPALDTEKCGPAQPEPQSVSIVNESTGERMGPRGPEPTRFGDWELKGRCSDF